MSQATEGRQSTLEVVLPSMVFLPQHYETKYRGKTVTDLFMTASLNRDSPKLLKYFKKLD